MSSQRSPDSVDGFGEGKREQGMRGRKEEGREKVRGRVNGIGKG